LLLQSIYLRFSRGRAFRGRFVFGVGVLVAALGSFWKRSRRQHERNPVRRLVRGRPAGCVVLGRRFRAVAHEGVPGSAL
jgi:hypothetical protein